jgi:NAD(P)-dependent dehydrogenase (short-subunit alcohol dehydrogenase family)
MSMHGRHVAVIGASGGIGLETARLLADRGARVSLGGRDRGRLDAAVKEIGGGTAIVVDGEDASSLRQFFAEAGPITDLGVTMTRRGGGAPAADLAEADLEGAFRGKTIAHLRAIALALPSLAPDASVTLVTAGSYSLPGSVPLAAANGALEAAIRPLAVELAPRRVNAVSPGVIETGWWEEVPPEARQELFSEFARRVPAGRNGRPQDVAQAIVALVENGFVTGVVFPCDGGLRLT